MPLENRFFRTSRAQEYYSTEINKRWQSIGERLS